MRKKRKGKISMFDEKNEGNPTTTNTNVEGNSGEFVISENFGTLLQYYRVRVRGMSLKQVENETSISSSYINRLERGEKTSPSLPIVLKLAECLQIPYSILMATIFQRVDEKTQPTISEVLIQNNFTLHDQELSKEARSILITINEFLVDCTWDAGTKVKELYMLSEMLDEFKAAI